MELWIRSQKEGYVDDRLIKVNDIALEYGDDETYYIVVNNGVEVAYYHSEKRALEVLDEIQNILDKRKNFDEMAKYIDNGTQIIEFSTAVYEMPQEREEK